MAHMAADPRTTGRYIVLLRPDEPDTGVRQLVELTGVRVMHSRSRDTPPEPPERCIVVFDHIGAALLYCSTDAGQVITQAAQAGDTGILAIEPERRVHATGTGAANGATWGIEAVGALASPYSGRGIRIAILDTGFDLEHPDFQGRNVTARSFVEGESAHDESGHGTHCAGIAAGPAAPEGGPRYGVAADADLFIGKVLSNRGHGTDGSVLEGIDWAVQNRCEVVSMSLGSPVQPGETYSTVFETVAQRALQAGTLIVAAAGNESRRPAHIAPVGHPANCPSILGVAAVDRALQVAPFSCGGLEPAGGEVDLAAPGVDIESAWPIPQRRHTISGTSMATPFVAGIAALHAEADARLRAAALGERLKRTARALDAPARDVGAGLVQAPQQE